MKHTILILLIAGISFTGCSQNASQKNKSSEHIGGPCEGCEAIYESPIAFEKLSYVDTLPDFNEPGPKLKISGIVYKNDGKTPAKDVIIYVYHTDQTGHYTKKGNETGWGKRHGYIRGWVKTNERGEYKFYTLKPAAYPGRNIPAHIHPVIKEPGKNDYWIDEYLFDDDPLLTTSEKSKQQKRGGDGIVHLKLINGIWEARRDIILGLNVPDYPVALHTNIKSGLAIGSNCPAFDPLHISGADAGRHVCPMCKYGYGQGIMVWFNHANLDQMKNFATTLESEMKQRGEKNLRVFLVYMNPFYKEKNGEGEKVLGEIRKWCAGQNLQHVAMLWVPSPVDAESCGLYKINPAVKNTVFVYKKRKITDKWINIDYNDKYLKAILAYL